MADLKITVPSAILTRVLNGFCGQHGYQTTINGQANPESKADFATRKIREFVKDSVKAYEATQAAEAERLSKLAAAETEIVIS